MGTFSKQVLVNWAEFDCERQLFLLLGEKDEQWIQPFRKIIPLKRRRTGLRTSVAQLGKNYEQDVYAYLSLLSEAVFHKAASNQVAQAPLSKEKLEEFFHQIENGETRSLVLLEHSIHVPQSLEQVVFGSTDMGNLRKPEKIRPDILILGKLSDEEDVFAILPDGSVVPVAKNDNRLFINIIDIKVSSEESIGKKHFIEILFYAQMIAIYLKENGLDDRFFVKASGNGILPNRERIIFREVQDIYDSIVEVRWRETIRVYKHALEVIQKLAKKRPLPVEAVELKLQPACGRCNYLEDCKSTLGIGHEEDPKKWDLQLIPYTSPSIARQLKDKGFSTVGDVAEKIGSLEIGDVPEPIYAEMPTLELKAKALAENKELAPPPSRLYTMKIPKFSDISLEFTAEADPVHERVLGVAFYYQVVSFSGRPFSSILDGLFSVFAQVFREEHVDVEDFVEAVNVVLSTSDSARDLDEDKIKELFEILLRLRNKPSIRTRIVLKGETIPTRTKGDPREATHAQLSFEYGFVNQGLGDREEVIMAKDIVRVLHDLIFLSDFIEQYVGVRQGGVDDMWVVSPIFAIYYWSVEVLQCLEDLLQRTFLELMFDEKIRQKLDALVDWFSPSESYVKNSSQFKKVFDLRQFVESVIGIPMVLNYTWHGLYRHYTGFEANARFWTENFNYMDFNEWYDFLGEEDPDMRETKRKEIRDQLLFKVRALDSLRIRFQQNFKALISQSAKPVKTQQLKARTLPPNYHRIAVAWYLFSKLSGTVQEMEAEHYRHMFPEFSIGKLVAAKIDDLEIEEHTGARGGKYYSYKFRLKGLSSNMKISEGDKVLLVPEELRDSRMVLYWAITIASIDWNNDLQCFDIQSENVNTNYLEKCKEITEGRECKNWYLYPSAGDYWSRKLFDPTEKKIGLLQNKNIGSSWLGYRLAYLLGLDFEGVSVPTQKTFTAAELYLYLPEAFSELNPTEPQATDFVADVEYTPNSSQKQAILTVLNNVISAIQGPPGTGKSQVIATLIDELIARASKSGRPIRILVSAFSYQALMVILEKTNQLRHRDGAPSYASKIQKIFVRSASRSPVNPSLADDLVRTGSSWKLNGRTRLFTKKQGTRQTLLNHIDDSFILFANPHQLYHLAQHNRDGTSRECFPDLFGFDVIICDEASQMPVDQFIAPLLFVKPHKAKIKPRQEYVTDGRITSIEGLTDLDIEILADPQSLTRVVLVGDENQLPPVQPVKPPEKLKPVLGSVFSYYLDHHSLPCVQLEVNYRSHELIVEYTRLLGLYQNLNASPYNAKKTLNGDFERIHVGWVKHIMDPQRVTGAIIHPNKYETAVSKLEAMITRDLAIGYFDMVNPSTEEEEKDFWMNKIGIVAPHNAQGRMIIRLIFDEMIQRQKTSLPKKELMIALRRTIFSVEKFQGSDRDFIIASIGISSTDQLLAEEEFIYELNRFNVLTSRAKSKLVLVVSQNFLDYFPRNRDIMENAAKIRMFATEFCDEETTFQVHGENIVYRFKRAKG